MIVSLKVKELEKGKHYVAYSAKSKKLSSNGKAGLIVKVVELKGQHVDIVIPSFGNFAMTLMNNDERLDAWIAPLEGFEFQLQGEVSDKFPGFTKGMQGQIITLDNELEIEGLQLLTGETVNEDKDARKFRMVKPEWATVHGNPVVIPFQRKEEEEAKELERLREEARQRQAARMAEAITLGKGLTDGQLEQLNWMLPIRDRILKVRGERRTSTACFCRIFVQKEGHIGVLEADKVKLDENFGGACHSGMGRAFPDKYPVMAGVWCDHNPKSCEAKKEHQLAWINYIINHSGIAKYHLVKDPEDVYKNGYLLHTDCPNRLFHVAISCTRQCWEHTAKGVAFGELLDQGVHPHFAWYAAQFASGGYGSLKLNGTASHTFMNQDCMDDKALLQFLSGKPVKDYPLIRKQPGYHGTDEQWGGGGLSSFGKHLRDHCGGVGGGGFNQTKTHPIEKLAKEVQDAGEAWAKKMGIDINKIVD